MGEMILTALVTAFAVALGHHLGLVEKVSGVAVEVASCARCSVFWAVLAVLLLERQDIVLSIGIAMLLAYATDWVGILLYRAAEIYERVWQRTEKQKKPNRRVN